MKFATIIMKDVMEKDIQTALENKIFLYGSRQFL